MNKIDRIMNKIDRIMIKFVRKGLSVHVTRRRRIYSVLGDYRGRGAGRGDLGGDPAPPRYPPRFAPRGHAMGCRT